MLRTANMSQRSARRFLFLEDSQEEQTKETFSPDEFVISLRGRRSRPVTWSPDDNVRKQDYYNKSKQAASPPAVKTRSSLGKAAYKRMVLGPEDCYIKKSKKTDPGNMMTSRANQKRISFSPESLKNIDLNTPLKIKLLISEKPQVKKPVSKLNLDVVSTPEGRGADPRKRALDNDGGSSVSAPKRERFTS